MKLKTTSLLFLVCLIITALHAEESNKKRGELRLILRDKYEDLARREIGYNDAVDIGSYFGVGFLIGKEKIDIKDNTYESKIRRSIINKLNKNKKYTFTRYKLGGYFKPRGSITVPLDPSGISFVNFESSLIYGNTWSIEALSDIATRKKGRKHEENDLYNLASDIKNDIKEDAQNIYKTIGLPFDWDNIDKMNIGNLYSSEGVKDFVVDTEVGVGSDLLKNIPIGKLEAGATFSVGGFFHFKTSAKTSIFRENESKYIVTVENTRDKEKGYYVELKSGLEFEQDNLPISVDIDLLKFKYENLFLKGKKMLFRARIDLAKNAKISSDILDAIVDGNFALAQYYYKANRDALLQDSNEVYINEDYGITIFEDSLTDYDINRTKAKLTFVANMGEKEDSNIASHGQGKVNEDSVYTSSTYDFPYKENKMLYQLRKEKSYVDTKFDKKLIWNKADEYLSNFIEPIIFSITYAHKDKITSARKAKKLMQALSYFVNNPEDSARVQEIIDIINGTPIKKGRFNSLRYLCPVYIDNKLREGDFSVIGKSTLKFMIEFDVDAITQAFVINANEETYRAAYQKASALINDDDKDDEKEKKFISTMVEIKKMLTEEESYRRIAEKFRDEDLSIHELNRKVSEALRKNATKKLADLIKEQMGDFTIPLTLWNLTNKEYENHRAVQFIYHLNDLVIEVTYNGTKKKGHPTINHSFVGKEMYPTQDFEDLIFTEFWETKTGLSLSGEAVVN
jgi:hypothetical protein